MTQCTVCRLPVEARRQIEGAYRRKEPIRRIAADLAITGRAIASATIHRHCTRCLPPADVDVLDSITLMAVVRSALRGHHHAAAKITDALIDAGATTEAAIVATACLESYKPALDGLPGESFATFMLEAYALADAVRRVLGQPCDSNVATATAMADAALELGADDMASALRELASRAAGNTVSPAGEPTPDGTASPPAGPQEESE